jgi:hypothetical protein
VGHVTEEEGQGKMMMMEEDMGKKNNMERQGEKEE